MAVNTIVELTLQYWAPVDSTETPQFIRKGRGEWNVQVTESLVEQDDAIDDESAINESESLLPTMTAGELLTSQFLLALLCTGWLVATLAGFGVPAAVHIILASALLLGWLGFLAVNPWKLVDLRFLIAPILILAVGWLAPYWTHPQLWDQAAHLQIANRFLERWSWEPSGQGLGFAFRPQVIPGIAAVEMKWSGEQYHLVATPFLLLLGTAWILQHLAERWSNRSVGWMSVVVFLTFPVVVVTGRSMLVDVAVAGAVILTILKLYSAYEKGGFFAFFSLGFVAGCTGLAKYPYLYLGPYFVLLALVSRRQKSAIPVAIGWVLATLPFFLQNLIQRGNMLASLSTQIEGTVTSLTGDLDEYSTRQFLVEFVSEWTWMLLLLATAGSFWCWRNHRRELLISSIVLAPAIVLFGVVLDFGYPRYQIPWLLLLAAFVPAAAMIEIGKLDFNWLKERNVRAATVTATLLLLASLSNTVVTLLDEREDVLESTEYRWGVVGLFLDVEDSLPEDAVVLASASTNFGLFTGTRSLNYEQTEDPVYDSILLNGATHAFNQEPGPKLEWETNWTYLLGSPLTPVDVSYLGNKIAVLWSVDDARMASHAFWMNVSWNVEGAAEQFADVVVLDATATAEPPRDASISRIVRVQDGASVHEVAMLDAGVSTTAENLCSTIVTCSGLDRQEHLSERWVMWAMMVS